jgi:hypothetical protein
VRSKKKHKPDSVTDSVADTNQQQQQCDADTAVATASDRAVEQHTTKKAV